MRISDWSSDVCSSDLHPQRGIGEAQIEIADRERSNVMDFKLCQWALCHRVNPRLFWPFILADVGDFPNIPESSVRDIGRASCRERVCQYVSISVFAVSLKKKTTK